MTKRTITNGAAQRCAQHIERLSQLFPAFSIERPRPLKIGIHHDLIAAGYEISHRDLRKVMRWYCSRLAYVSQLGCGGWRVDLQGNPVAEITEHEIEMARASVRGIIAATNKRDAARKAQTARQNEGKKELATVASAPPPPEPPVTKDPQSLLASPPPEPAKPTRLGLSDLKRAALARKASAAKSSTRSSNPQVSHEPRD
jgi:sRNA-binding protein